MTGPANTPQLRRELGVVGAVLMGLGAIVGTGVFVSIGIAAGIAGPLVIVAIGLAAIVATCNGLSSAQLAASHPVSGGTYEYGYRYLTPSLGFVAGWMFLCAKAASAATAALGFSGYLLYLISPDSDGLLVPVALAAVIILGIIVLTGLRRSNAVNITIVSVTLFALIAFVVAGFSDAINNASINLFTISDSDRSGLPSLLESAALMFVAYTGYGRIATMGEEVKEPRRTIPRAIIATLLVSMLLYAAVAIVGVGAVGADMFASATESQAAPLEVVARAFGIPGVPLIVAIGAITAMLGVLLNLILGLSRVLLAMGRRGDMPSATANLDRIQSTPYVAVIIITLVIAGLTLIGDLKTVWSFSAFTVLIYYALTNLSALRLGPGERLFPVALAWLGLGSCLFLAFWVESTIWLVGLGLIGCGFLWRFLARKLSRR